MSGTLSQLIVLSLKGATIISSQSIKKALTRATKALSIPQNNRKKFRSET
jgi:hypothetical protein